MKLGKIFYWLTTIASIVYIVNPGAGVLEFVPDNLPVVGNLDEATATGVLLFSLRELGFIGGSKKKKEDTV